ncbi:DNA cytosine methyltransferase [Natronomonas sp. F2-12]|jgi:DNA (cytosine-5)-methyltransferase 1|uniref:DNA (cytosine-5-)-methyltransferase n=1 Tax=Natronomonas aquatica TaxID=2841590 RepID=A0A9R1CSV5_9EURY|nr:DNA cytosine methyltransferase [Natronomonas aquatica]MCQ4333305.1 DNA cytosine methyltransferase [Natronomonas aquatica]
MNGTVVDLFCGAGGLSHGFQSAGFDVIAGVDNEAKFKQTFEENHNATFVEADLESITGGEILSTLSLDPGDVDVLIGGPPCQGFSLAGATTTPGDERNFLITQFIKAVYQIKPEWFVMENVPRITTMEDGAVLKYLLSQFDKIGYSVSHSILNSVHFGVPQRRKRAFFVGNANGRDLSLPEGSYRESAKQQTLFDQKNRKPRTVEDAFSDLPAICPGESATEYATSPQGSYQKYLRSETPELRNHQAPAHGDSVINRIKRAEQGKRIPYDSWSQKRRLEDDEPAPTLLAGPRPTYHFAHPTQHRGLSVRERARLQSFPDHFTFYGPVAKQRQMTGNAVPPLVSEAVAASILTAEQEEEITDII